MGRGPVRLRGSRTPSVSCTPLRTTLPIGPCVTIWLGHKIEFILRQNIMHICLLCFTAPVKSKCSWIRSTGMNHTLTIPYCSYAQHISLHYSITFLCISPSLFPISFPLFLAHSNLAAPSSPQGGMKINSEDMQCWKEHDICICCVTGRQHWVCGAPLSFLLPVSPDESFTWEGVFYLVQTCQKVFFPSSFSLKGIPINEMYLPSCCFIHVWFE